MKSAILYIDLENVLMDYFPSFCKLVEGDKEFSQKYPTKRIRTLKEFEFQYGEEAISQVLANAPSTFWEDVEFSKDGMRLWEATRLLEPIILTEVVTARSVTGKNAWCYNNLHTDH